MTQSRVAVIQAEAICTAVIRGVVPRRELSRFVPEACGEVWAFVRSAGLPRPGRHVALYLDGEINLEVGVELAEPFVGDGQVSGSSTPAGLVATTTHMGPYHRLGEAHGAILG